MKIAIFCGSSNGNDEIYINAAKELSKYLAQNNIDIVYGGGNVGLMGTVASTALEYGGKVYGVIPVDLQDKELGHEGLTELKIVADMHERKATMADMADAFVALAGGIGTFEEIFEVWTWAQLGYHDKPCAFYNTKGFYDNLFSMIDTICNEGFMKKDYSDMLIKTTNPKELLEKINSYTPPKKKWTK
ncbi:TIGR00730 family Rossman fold protein [Arcobacter sp. YIC-464]|uniref:LOG family protein n=1 Tax=Arcobacter sp. YIC-464 TaxID=3376631 RepID=UPI003C18F64F